MGSLSLLQWIFPTQELNQGLLPCRWILYQLSYQGSPTCVANTFPEKLSDEPSEDYSMTDKQTVTGQLLGTCVHGEKAWQERFIHNKMILGNHPQSPLIQEILNVTSR